ncbi:hypothetical protein K3495_g5199 [Podosphaera aphanis]|nr:hypothetical protein K3495_g5199 [Podosphaera aphanis]
MAYADISATNTPEQNGVSEAAKKVVLRLARSILIDARTHACSVLASDSRPCMLHSRQTVLSSNKTDSKQFFDFMQGLNQRHTGKIYLKNTPRLGSRAYKPIPPKPGKFEPRATKGWFTGIQRNTNKNFIIYHLHHTSSQRWKWIESFTPHATFNKDVMFGEEFPSTVKQRTYSYWGDHNSLFSEASMGILQNNIPSSPEYQTPESFEREPLPLTPEADPITRDENPRPTSEGESITKLDDVTESPRSRIEMIGHYTQTHAV